MKFRNGRRSHAAYAHVYRRHAPGSSPRRDRAARQEPLALWSAQALRSRALRRAAASQNTETVHCSFDDAWNRSEIWVRRFACLKKCIGIVLRAADERRFGIKRACSMSSYQIVADHGTDFTVVKQSQRV